jgi:predicted amidohydrolase YtcJ
MRVLFREVEVAAERVDVLVDGSRVAAIGRRLQPEDEQGLEVVDGRGGALLPGLHDHHVHLLALAAAQASVDCGPRVRDKPGLASALRAAEGAWVRGTGYHQSVAGDLDRQVRDELVPDRLVRVQHRSGALWMLNSRALEVVSGVLDDSPDVERDQDGKPTGRLWRYDARLRPALPQVDLDLARVGQTLAEYGITGVTDATPDLDAGALSLLGGALARGDLPQSVMLLGAPAGAGLAPRLSAGPVKLLLRDHDLPTFRDLSETIATVHGTGRRVAVHCVSSESLVLTLAALEQVGALQGDRIEHAAVVPPGIASWVAALGLAVVTQPDLLRSRGEQYLHEVDPAERPFLYPFRSLLSAGVRVAASSDAPYGDLDPWQAMRTAARRTSAAGETLEGEETVSPATALAGYLSAATDPGGTPRRIKSGAAADLCLLHVPLAEALREPAAELVRLTSIAGRLHHSP